MLKLHLCSSLVPLEKIYEKIDFEKETLILSNLRSKKEIQNILLGKNGFHLSDSILRASDFWGLLLRRYHPHKKLISTDYAKMTISSWLRQQGSTSENSLQVNENLSSTLYQMLIQLSGFFLREDGELPLDEWLNENPDIRKRLNPWFKQIKDLTEYFARKNFILTEMIPEFLLSDLDLEKKWDRPLWIDLGSELSLAEAEIFQALSRSHEVNIIAPDPEWKSKYEYLLRPYDYLKNQSQSAEQWKYSSGDTDKIKTYKLSGRLAEVKNAVGLIRSWVDSGISPAQICIIASQIETYWPVLNTFLKTEGIPSQKDIVVKLMSLPSILRWVSILKSKARGLNTSDLEYSLYSEFEIPVFEFDKFNSVFKNLYSEQDLFRIQDIKEWFFADTNTNTPLQRDQFIVLALKHWKDDFSRPELQTILKELVANTTANDLFLFSDWIGFVQKIATRKEKTVIEGDDNGIEVTQIMSGHSSKCTHRIFLGLAEEDFASSNHHFFNFHDKLQLSKDLGFQIEHPEQNFRNFQLEWLFTNGAQENILSFGLTNFDGQLLNPLSQWVKFREKDNPDIPLEVEIPLTNRWDKLLKLPIEEVLKKERDLSENQIAATLKRIKEDSGEVSEEATPHVPLRISPSSLESYLRCPFIFKSERVYKLISLAEADLDIDPRPYGNFVHRLFEKILAEKNLETWTDAKLSDLVEAIKLEQDSYLFDKDFWLAQKKKFISMGQKFIAFEQNWKKEHPQSKNIGREVQWKLHYDLLEKKFIKSDGPTSKNSILISGKIDRIDSVDQNLKIIIDYKSSSTELASFSKWLEKHQLQLLFYMWVLENGFAEDQSGEVIAAVYYIFRNFKRDQGFRLSTVPDEIIGPTKKTAMASIEAKNSLLVDFEQLLKECITNMYEGNFQAKPKDLKTCDKCNWSLVCRAPHLN